jgi:dihydropteroate synthase-like protein
LKVLVVTGKLAYPIVHQAVSGVKDAEIDVKVLDYPVAALMSTRYILENLKSLDVSKYDYVILPGLVFGDAKVISERLGVKTYKGTEEAADIPLVIEALLKGKELSTSEPADRILSEERAKSMRQKLESLEGRASYAFEVRGLKVPLRPPPFRVFVEIPPHWEEERVRGEVERMKEFMDVAVIGSPSGNNDPEAIRRKVRTVLDLGVHVGVDSDSPTEIEAGVREGASFVFNLNEENFHRLKEIRSEDVAFVVAPLSPVDRGEITYKLVTRAKGEGFQKIIADPILSPPLRGVMESLEAYSYLGRRLQDVPMLMGLLNVTELLDADSHGINAFLVALAYEVGASNLMVMEKGKTRWSSWEVRKAARMVSVAAADGRFLKDLGEDLLILKDKRSSNEPYERVGEEVRVNERIEPEMDSGGFAKIGKIGDEVYVAWYGRDKLTVRGKYALSVGRALIRRVKPISPEHALYIGYELAKAEIAASLGKSYFQDRPLFRRLGERE